MPPTVKLGTCTLPLSIQHIAPGDSCRADYSKLWRGLSTSVPKAAQPNNDALWCARLPCAKFVGISSILVLISRQLAIFDAPIVNLKYRFQAITVWAAL